ncbi:8582_t:CDS:2 [Entrophospora sp. SA101]|nr:8582_t:CDS:2 [Entrophospora sp. SA101]
MKFGVIDTIQWYKRSVEDVQFEILLMSNLTGFCDKEAHLLAVSGVINIYHQQ